MPNVFFYFPYLKFRFVVNSDKSQKQNNLCENFFGFYAPTQTGSEQLFHLTYFYHRGRKRVA
jgi:hypothetical protein